AATVTEWRKTLPGGLELLFLQQCGKGAIENFYEMRGSARFVLASETRIGAPNAYYADTLRALCERPSVDGAALAASIVEHESEEMFTQYAAADSAALDEIPARLDALAAPLVGLPRIERPRVLTSGDGGARR